MVALTNNEDSKETGKQWINPKNAIKNMKWIVFLIVIIAVIISFLVQLFVNDDNDLRNATSLAVEIIFGIFIALVVYVYSKKMDIENKELQTETQKRIEQAVENTSKEIVKKVVDIANAQLRVNDGGKVALREGGDVGADIVRNVNESVNTNSELEEFLEKLKDVEPVSNNKNKHSESYVVAEQKAQFTADVILVNSPQKEVDEIRKEIEELKIDLKDYRNIQKRRKSVTKNKNKKAKTKLKK